MGLIAEKRISELEDSSLEIVQFRKQKHQNANSVFVEGGIVI
jgi:hypothetical protein